MNNLCGKILCFSPFYTVDHWWWWLALIELLFLNDKIPPHLPPSTSLKTHQSTNMADLLLVCPPLRRLAEKLGSLYGWRWRHHPPPPSLTWLGKFFFQKDMGWDSNHACIQHINVEIWKEGTVKHSKLFCGMDFSLFWYALCQFQDSKHMNCFTFKKTGSQTREYMTRNSLFLVYIMVISARLRREF
jgi:hypothetical protein